MVDEEAVTNIRALTLAKASNGTFGRKNKLAGDEVSELVLRSEDPVRGLSEDDSVNVCNGHLIDPLLGPEKLLSLLSPLSLS